jgi:NAD(P) transhydrogenase subunit beta
MLATISQFTIGATDLMVISLLISGFGMLITILASSVYVFSVTTSGISLTFDAGLAAFGFILSKLWTLSVLLMVIISNLIGSIAASAFAAEALFGNHAGGTIRLGVTLAAALIGAVSLSRSMIAWTRLSGFINQPFRLSGHRALTAGLMAIALAVVGYVLFAAQDLPDHLLPMPALMFLLFGCAVLLGAVTTLPIGMPQLPRAISTCNALTGLAIGLEGFSLRSPTLLLAGLAVGAARMLLTLQMTQG